MVTLESKPDCESEWYRALIDIGDKPTVVNERVSIECTLSTVDGENGEVWLTIASDKQLRLMIRTVLTVKQARALAGELLDWASPD